MSSSSNNKNDVASAVGGKTARACDSCITKRARWYCAADDAFLCQACDSSVHSANSLARRHERVRLKTASYKSTTDASASAPSWWHRGFTKKARTPRHGKHYSTTRSTPKSSSSARNPFHLVPEVGLDEVNSHEENEAQLLYRVPIFDPFVAELSSPPSSTELGLGLGLGGGVAVVENKGNKGSESTNKVVQLGEMESFHGLLPSDIELAEFAADVENLLGRGLENECIGMEELGLIDTKQEEESLEYSLGSEKVKVEGEESPDVVQGDQVEIMGGKESSFELNFDYDSQSHETCEEVKEKVVGEQKENNNNNKGKRKISLQLDYEAVIIAWAGQKSPWTTDDKPNLDADVEGWPDCMGTCETEFHYPYGELSGFGCHPVMADGGREARVSRYREKRRTRLFSKKIRYEVRKLNAEKRPRMKGRFVKRASFTAPTFPLLK